MDEDVKEEIHSREALCRVCACYTQLLIPIFDGEGLENSIPDKIDKHLPVKVNPSDILPTHICYQCASTIISWHELTTTCVEAEHKLQTLFGNDNAYSSDVQMSPAGIRDDDDADVCADLPPDSRHLDADGLSSPNLETVNKDHENEAAVTAKEDFEGEMPKDGAKERLDPRGKISFAEYHAIRNSSSSNYQLECSASQVPTALISKDVITKSSNVIVEAYQYNSSSSPSDSSDSSDDNYVPPKKLRATSSRKETRASRVKKQEPSKKPTTEKGLLKCLMCVRYFKRNYDLSRHMEAHHSDIKSEPEEECGDIASCGEEIAANVEMTEDSGSPTNNEAAVKGSPKKAVNQVTCNNCNRKFRSKEALQRHVTGDRCIMNLPANTDPPPEMGATVTTATFVGAGCPADAGAPLNAEEGNVNIKEEGDIADFDDMQDSDYSESSEESDQKEKCPRPGPSKEKPIYKCDVCNKQFKLKESYTTHTRIHTGEKPFTCHMCGKQFSHSGGLSYHLRHVHMGIKDHPCDICGRKFALKAAMQDHRRIHTGERPYVCDVCGKSFKSKASLYIHSKTHTDQFPHPCEYCNKKFRWRQQLLGHLTTHTGEKKHHCKICNKGFGVRNDLTRHERIHSGQKPFKCSVCGLAFGQKRYLKNHLKSRHGILRMENMEATSA